MSANSLLVATAELRWFKEIKSLGLGYGTKWELVLQQYWTDPLGVSGRGEWRTVPTVLTEKQQGLTEPPTLEN